MFKEEPKNFKSTTTLHLLSILQCQRKGGFSPKSRTVNFIIKKDLCLNISDLARDLAGATVEKLAR